MVCVVRRGNDDAEQHGYQIRYRRPLRVPVQLLITGNKLKIRFYVRYAKNMMNLFPGTNLRPTKLTRYLQISGNLLKSYFLQKTLAYLPQEHDGQLMAFFLLIQLDRR